MANPYLKENPLLPPLPTEWDHLPSLRELMTYRSAENPNDPFPIYPGIEYCWVLVQNRKTAATKEKWTALRGVDVFTVNGHAVVLMGRGEPIAGARLDCTEPVLRVDPDLDAKLNPKLVAADEKRTNTKG